MTKINSAAATSTVTTSQRLPLTFMKEGKRVSSKNIWLTPECTALTEHEPEVFTSLKADIALRIKKGDRQILREPIQVTHTGEIVDGRHRARALVELGKGKDLYDAIKNAIASPADQDADPFPLAVQAAATHMARNLQVASMQGGRRNSAKWQIANLVIEQYAIIAEASKKGRLGGHSVVSDDGTPFRSVKEFCDRMGVSERTFQTLMKIRQHRRAYALLQQNKLTFTNALKVANGLLILNDKGQAVPKRSEAKPNATENSITLQLRSEDDVEALFSRLSKNDPAMLNSLIKKLVTVTRSNASSTASPSSQNNEKKKAR